MPHEQSIGPPYVYFVQRGHDGPIKVGWTSKPHVVERVATLQTASPHDLHIRAIMPEAPRSTETDLHQRFRSLHIRGEWFWPGKELLAYIDEHAVPWSEVMSTPRERPAPPDRPPWAGDAYARFFLALEDAGLTVQEAADKLGCHASLVDGWCNGRTEGLPWYALGWVAWKLGLDLTRLIPEAFCDVRAD